MLANVSNGVGSPIAAPVKFQEEEGFHQIVNACKVSNGVCSPIAAPVKFLKEGRYSARNFKCPKFGRRI